MKSKSYLSWLKNRDNKGFTLVELIISFALLGIVTLIVFSMQSFSLRVFNRGEDRYQVQSGTGIVTEYITQRLRYAYKAVILENASLVPDSASISNNDAYIYIEDGTVKDTVMFRDKNGTSELFSFDSCQLSFSAASAERSLSFRIYGELGGESFDVDSGIVSLNLLLDKDRKITFEGTPGITTGSAVRIVRDPIAVSGTGLTFAPSNPPEGIVGTGYNSGTGWLNYSVLNGTPGYTYSASPRFPYGISLNSATGELSGTPIEPGEFNIAVIVKDSSTPQLAGYGIVTMTVTAAAISDIGAPRPKAVTIEGDIGSGGTLTAKFDSGYIDSDGDDTAITGYSYQWYIGFNADGTGSLTAVGTNSSTYVITEGDLNKYIFVKVTLQGNNDGWGLPVFNAAPVSTTPPVINAAPEARNVYIEGSVIKGSTLTGHYTYYDADTPADIEGLSIRKWYRSDKNNGSELVLISSDIGGASTNISTYTLKDTDVGKYIYFEVTPKANSGTITGITIKSANVGKVKIN